MDTAELASQLYRSAVDDEQSAYRIHAGDDVDELRRLVRQLARTDRIRVRTAVMDDVLVIVRTDATVWKENARAMRDKLTPPK